MASLPHRQSMLRRLSSPTTALRDMGRPQATTGRHTVAVAIATTATHELLTTLRRSATNKVVTEAVALATIEAPRSGQTPAIGEVVNGKEEPVMTTETIYGKRLDRDRSGILLKNVALKTWDKS